VLILDCDVHQGNGTAEIFVDDPTVFTMSMHGARNFPLRKYPSSLDVALEDGTGDDAYLRRRLLPRPGGDRRHSRRDDAAGDRLGKERGQVQ
jgi:hypothetical protein